MLFTFCRYQFCKLKVSNLSPMKDTPPTSTEFPTLVTLEIFFLQSKMSILMDATKNEISY